MSVVVFIGALGLVVATAALVAATLRVRGLPAFLLAAYVAGWAEIVLLGEGLSLVQRVDAPIFLAGEGVVFLAAFAVWRARGRLRPELPRLRPGTIAAHPLLVVLAVVVGAALAYQAFLVFATPPDNWDSMTYHLTRVAYWYQHGGIGWDASAPTARVNAYPPNAELGILYTILFLGRDTAAALPQLLAELALMVAVYGSARRLGFTRAASAFAGLLLATLSEFALQSVTTQNDLVVASFVAAAVFFVLGRSRAEVTLAGVALGLAVGTKLTGVFALPIVALLALALVPRRRLATLALATTLGVALLGSYAYVVDLQRTGHLLGPPSALGDYSPTVTPAGTESTVARVAYRFADLSGYPFRTMTLKPVADTAAAVFRSFHVDPNPPESTATWFNFWPNHRAQEDVSYFGPLGLLLIPLTLGALWARVFRRGNGARALVALALPLFVLELALAYRYSIWIGRFLTLPVALVLPLCAGLYKRRSVAAVVVLLGAVTLFFAHLDNLAKPPGGGAPPIWKLDRVSAQTITRPEMRAPLDAVNRLVGADASLGVVFLPERDDWVYPLYGPGLTRRLVTLPRPTELASADRLGLDAIVLGAGITRPALTGCWRMLAFPASGWKLLLRCRSGTSPTAQLASARTVYSAARQR